MEIEKQLLLLTCDIMPSEQKNTEITKLITRNAIDWDLFFRLIYQNKTYPIVYQNYKDILPPQQVQKLAMLIVKLQAQHTKLLNHMTQTCINFSDRNIPVIVLKGIPLSKQLYKSIYLRPTLDLDILIKENDLPATLNLLIQQGFKTTANREIYIKDFIDRKLGTHLPSLSNGHVIIELHRNLIPEIWGFNLREDLYWGNTDHIKINNYNFKVLNPELLFLYLCIHAIKHCFMLRLLYDISLLIRQYELDWQKINSLGKQNKLSSFIYYILCKTEIYFNTGVPSNILSAFRRDTSLIKLLMLKKINLPDLTDTGVSNFRARLLDFIRPSTLLFRIKHRMANLFDYIKSIQKTLKSIL